MIRETSQVKEYNARNWQALGRLRLIEFVAGNKSLTEI
jgi:hypothetical protein